MIRIDLAAAASIFTIFIVGAFFVFWFTQRRVRRGGPEQGQRLVQCPYCGNVSVDRSRKEIITCSICKSYVEVGHEDHGKKI